MMTQPKAVIEIIESLGGVATLGQINSRIFDIKDCEWKTKTPFASVRRIVRHTKGIYRIKPGLYALESHRHELERNGIVVETEHNADSSEVEQMNHYYYQGLLAQIGNLKGLGTYIPNQDKNRLFKSETLGCIRSLDELPPFGLPEAIRRSSTIDVIWFNERQMPDSFFEVEHSTDIQNSLLKYCDVRDFNVRMVIVANEKRRREFEHKRAESAFKSISDRVCFLTYESLERQYELYMEHETFEVKL